MADTHNNDLHFRDGASGKRNAPNVSSGWVVMVLSGLIAVVIFLFVTAQGTQKTQVLVATKNLAPGATVDASAFRAASVNVDQAQLNRLIDFKQLSSYTGYITTGPISSGDLITKTNLQPAASGNGNRTMSIPIDKTHANDGALKPGNRIDVINEPDQKTVVSNIEVLAVDSSGSGSFAGGASNFTLTVSVNAAQAEAISGVLKDAKFDLTNSTGSSPIGAVDSLDPTSTTSTTVTPGSQP